MDEYENLEEKLKQEFIKKNRMYKKSRGKIRRLVQIKKRNKNLIKKYDIIKVGGKYRE